MKYATIDNRHTIRGIYDTEPSRVSSMLTVVEIPDVEATKYADAKEANSRALLFWVDDAVIPLSDKVKLDAIARLSPEALAIKAAHDAAANAFESLSAGKRALWEPVRAAVQAAIKVGNFPLAYETIATVPNLYEGMEADRNTFLSLFQ